MWKKQKRWSKMNATTIWKLWNCGGRYYFGLHVFPPNYEIYSIASGTGKFYSKCYKVCHEAKDLKNLDHNWHDFTFLRLQICSFDWSDWLSVMVFEPLMMLAGTFSQNFSQRKKYHWYHAFEVMFLEYLNLLFKIWSFWLGVLSEMLKFLDDKRFWWRKNINSYGKIGMLNYYIVVVLKVTSDNTSVFKVAECYFKICYSKPSYQNWLPNYCAKPDDKCNCSDRCSRYS